MSFPFKNLFQDSFRSLLTGLGVPGRDRAVSMSPSMDTLTYNMRDLENLYRGNWLAKKIVDIPAFDCTRAWRTWNGEENQVEKLQKAEFEFGLQRKILDAMIKSRLYGGAAIVMGIKGQKFNEELNLDKVSKGGLKFIHVVEKWMIQAGPRVRDITSPWFGEPSYYMRSNTPIIESPGGVTPLEGSSLGYQPGDTIFIHPSRVVRMVGIEYPDVEHSPDAWGDSVLASVYEAIRDAGLVTQSLANMIADCKVDVFKVPGLTSTLSTQAGTDKMISYFANANIAKSVVNSLVIDKEIDWERIQTKLEGLPQVLQAYLLICAAGADIPSTRMLSREPSGQNATGESDTRNYYDRLSSEQEVIIRPVLSRLDEVLIRHTFGDRPPEIDYEWNPLWQMTDTEKADIALKKAQAYQIDVNTALIPAEALVIGRQNQLIEDGVYPGLQTALDDLAENWNEEAEFLPVQQMNQSGEMQQNQLESQENQTKLLAKPKPGEPGEQQSGQQDQFRDARARLRVIRGALYRDATPRTLYVRRDVINADDLIQWAKSQGFNTTLTDLHVTIAYSRNPVDWMKAEEIYPVEQLVVPPSGVRMVELFGPQRNCAVLLFNSSVLTRRHDQLTEMGASWDYPEYQPHIAISYQMPEGLDVTNMSPYAGPIILGPEVFETIKEKIELLEDEGGQSGLGFMIAGQPARKKRRKLPDQLTEDDGWEESLHPRGQPTNAGQFGPGGSSNNYGLIPGDVAKFKQLKKEWATVNNGLLEFIDKPDGPEARAKINELETIVREMHGLHADSGTPAGIGFPGGPRDVTIVGAGPGGLAASINGAAEGLDTLVIEANVVAGGQAKFSSRIENFPGFPIGVTGQRLTQSMFGQAKRLGAETALGVRVTAMAYDSTTGLKHLTLSNGQQIDSRTVILAGGVEFRRMEFPGSEGPGVITGDGKVLTEAGAGGSVCVIGGSNGAAQAALGCALHSNHVYLLARSPVVDSMSDYQISALSSNPKITVIQGDSIAKLIRDEHGNPQMVETVKGQHLPVKALGAFLGSIPETEWVPKSITLAKGGRVPTNSNFETSMPGVYAVGDMRDGAIGRVGVAVGEGQFALREANAFLTKQKNAQTADADTYRNTNNYVVTSDLITRLFALDRANPWLGQTVEDVKPLVKKNKAAAQAAE